MEALVSDGTGFKESGLGGFIEAEFIQDLAGVLAHQEGRTLDASRGIREIKSQSHLTDFSHHGVRVLDDPLTIQGTRVGPEVKAGLIGCDFARHASGIQCLKPRASRSCGQRILDGSDPPGFVFWVERR